MVELWKQQSRWQLWGSCKSFDNSVKCLLLHNLGVENVSPVTSSRSRFQTGRCSYSVRTAGNISLQKSRHLNDVKEFHARLVDIGHHFQLCESNTLMNMYVTCGSIADAHHVFDNMPNRNIVSWNTLILGYAKQEKGMLALNLYAQMQREGVQLSDRTFVGALKACSSLAALEKGKQVDGRFVKIGCLEKGRSIHSLVMKNGCESDVFVGTTLVDMYVKCGYMEDAWHAFEKLSHRNVVSWNAIILGYAKMEEGAVALDLYAQMCRDGVIPDRGTLVGALKACSSLAALEEKQDIGKSVRLGCLDKGRAIYCQVNKSHLESDVYVGTTVVDMYAKCGSMEDAWHVFGQLPNRVVSWNAIISGYAKKEEGALALHLYAQMQQEAVIPDHRTFVSALQACSSLVVQEEGKQVDGGNSMTEGCLKKGRDIHLQIIRNGHETDAYVVTTLVDMYAKCGSMQDAQHVFDISSHHDVVSWTAMISGYGKKEKAAQALELYARMQQEAVIPDPRTFVATLKACSSLAALEEGKHVDGMLVKIGCLEKGRAIHSQFISSGFSSDAFLVNTLLDMYAKCGSLADARYVFDESLARDVISWNAMTLAYAEQKQSEEAFKLYVEMQEQGLSADGLTFVSILKACGNMAALETGKELHSQIYGIELDITPTMATSLIDMYAKCGSMVDSQWLFDSLSARSVVMWNTLTAGYSRQGESERVLHIFERMRQEGIQPDNVTFLSLLTVCSRVGLVDMGHEYFQAMSQQYGIAPTVEHYACIVDLLSRAGQVDEAVAVVEKMPFQPDVVVWMTVLGACRQWKNVELGRCAFAYTLRLDEKHTSAYILMSNLCAHAHLWDDHAGTMKGSC